MDRAGWNLHANKFESLVCDIAAEGTNDELARMVRVACKARKNPVLVDLGCGVGTFIQQFGDRFSEIVGIEFAPRIIARARKHCAGMPNITWHAQDITRAPELISRRADLTVCLNVITSPSSAKRSALWSSVQAVTKRGGFALMVVPSAESNEMVSSLDGDDDEAPTDGLVKRDGIWQKHYRRDELVSILSNFSFKAKSIRRASYPWSVEGLRKPRLAGNRAPWDWVCLAKRV